jgi:hypothetical protein
MDGVRKRTGMSESRGVRQRRKVSRRTLVHHGALRMRARNWAVASAFGLMLSGCLGGGWVKTEPEVGTLFTAWNATPAELGLRFDSGHPQTNTVFGFPPKIPSGTAPRPGGCPSTQEGPDFWIAYRAVRRTGGPDFASTYEAVTPWYKWEGVKCPKQVYNLTLHEDYTFSLTRVDWFWSGKLAMHREERHETVPVATVTEARPSGWGEKPGLA